MHAKLKTCHIIKHINFKIIVCILLINSFISPIIVAANNEPKVDLKFTVSKDVVDIGEEITVKGIITPESIDVRSNYKDIVLVLDTSGSMNDYIDSSGKRKIDELKESVNSFLDKMKSIPDVRISIVTFNSRATIKSDLTDDIDRLKDIVNGYTGTCCDDMYCYDKCWYSGLEADGGTNIGDGVRLAGYVLQKSKYQRNNSEKNIILMTDGEPTSYSYLIKSCHHDRWNKWCDLEYYLDFEDNKEYESTSGTSSDDDDIKYAQEVGQKIKENNYNVYSIGYDLKGTDGGNALRTLKGIHNSMTDKEENFYESNKGYLEDMFKDVADKINYSATDVNLKLDLKEDFELLSGNESVKIDNIIYTNSLETNLEGYLHYKARPVEFTFKIKAKKSGEFNIFRNAKLKFEWNDQNIEILVEPYTIYVKEEKESKVKMKVTDTGGSVLYDSNNKKDDIDKNYKLYGKSILSIDVSDTQASSMEYIFKKDGKEVDRQRIDLNNDSDIDKSNEGYLTQMPYDVSHMELRDNKARWSNRQEVYKTPFESEVSYISTEITGKDQEYVKKQESTGRYVPKTFFLQNNSVCNYAPEYKESSKTWGYMTVPIDGDYYFKAITDDGFYGTIFVDGKTEILSNDFKVKWYKEEATAPKKISLKSGVYYPIYIEYFNWGGAACNLIEAKTNRDYNYREINELGFKFYPSKSKIPMHDANNIFMGNKDVTFKTDPGKYTIEYSLLNDKEEKIKGGSFGTFEVEERFNLKKSVPTKSIEQGDIFEIKYILKPKDILVSDLYKKNFVGDKPTKIYVKDIELNDSLPSNLIFVENKSNNISKSKDYIIYELKGYKYIAEEYDFRFNIKCKDNSEGVNIIKSGKIGYRDVSLNDNLRISQTQEFDNESNITFDCAKSEIGEHGVFNGNSIENTDEHKFCHNTIYNMGFIINAQGFNNDFTITADSAELKISNVYIYELDDNIIKGEPIKIDNKIDITKEKNGIGQYLLRYKKYLVKYDVVNDKGGQEVSINAKMDTGSQKKITLNFEQELPDLF